MYFSVLTLATLIACVTAQATNSSTTATTPVTQTTTTNVSAGSTTQSISAIVFPGYTGSIVNADACGTTIAIACGNRTRCTYGQSTPTGTVTIAPNSIDLSIVTKILSVSIISSYSCTYNGSQGAAKEATCVEQYSRINGTQTTTRNATTTTYSSSGLYQPIYITANYDALSTATGVCTPSPAAAAPTAVAIREIYKVLVPVGAALLAMA